jgi:hypothetical protein
MVTSRLHIRSKYLISVATRGVCVKGYTNIFQICNLSIKSFYTLIKNNILNNTQQISKPQNYQIVNRYTIFCHYQCSNNNLFFKIVFKMPTMLCIVTSYSFTTNLNIYIILFWSVYALWYNGRVKLHELRYIMWIELAVYSCS